MNTGHQRSIDLVCVLSTWPDIIGHRLVCRKTINQLSLDYHLAIDRHFAQQLQDLFSQRPFRRVRIHRHRSIGLVYGGTGSSVSPRQVNIYVLVCEGRSRIKHRVTVSRFVQEELEWLENLSEHIPEVARPIIEA